MAHRRRVSGRESYLSPRGLTDCAESRCRAKSWRLPPGPRPGGTWSGTTTRDPYAVDAGIGEVPGGGAMVVARLDAASNAAAGAEIELALQADQVKLFAPASGAAL